MRRLAPSVAVLAALAAAPAGADAAPGDAAVVRSGSLRAVVAADPWRLELRGPGGVVLRERSELALGFRTAAGWSRAVRATELRRVGRGLTALVATAGGGELRVTVRPAGEGGIAVAAARTAGAGPVEAFGIGFGLPAGERLFGFGSRSDAVDHRGREVQNYVADGPARPRDREFPRAVVPPWAHGDRDDSTYYPVPWMLSSRGYGVLIDRDETSWFRLGTERPDSWSLEVDAPALSIRVFAGPRPADALRRFTAATGRQPRPPAPWTYGPWFQTGQSNRVELDEEAAMIRAQRAADVPVSAAETQMHFLPCGAHRDDPAYNAARTRQFHRAGLAHLVYFNPSLCTSYQPVWSQSSAQGLLIREQSGQPHVYPAFVGGDGPGGFTTEPLSQFDFRAPGIAAYYGRLLREAVAGGHDGWMEDFGEGVPPSGRAADGSTGSALHNRYPTDYHCTVARIVRGFGRPLNRHLRSGWTGTARCAVDVWGGDPTTVWGYDGLESGVRQALGIGMSGVSRFGTDIGGYNTYGPDEELTPELLARWIEFGAVSGVMRTKASGLAFPPYERPQVFDPGMLPLWRRYTKLHAQLYPYIRAADRRYRATGMPIMRHLALSVPRDARAAREDDQLLFGPDLLAAPVVAPGVKRRRVYAPRGRWLDWWRSVRFERRDGSFRVARARVLRGRREHVLPAPLEELPLLVRAGAVLPMLSADVDTLAPHGPRAGEPAGGTLPARLGGGRLVRLADRADRMTLLAFPRGLSRRKMLEGERLRSRELRGRRGGWELRIHGARSRTYSIEASLAALRERFTPCGVTAGGRPLPDARWSYSPKTRVLRVRVIARRVTLLARRGC